MLSVIQEYRVQTSDCKHHTIGETAKKKNDYGGYSRSSAVLAYLVRGTAPLVCGRSSNKIGQHRTHTVGFSGPGS
jgi:hypothetical protein